MIPWELYNLSARDQASALIRPYHEYKNEAFVGVVAGSSTFTVPEEVMLLLTYVSVASENGTGLPTFLRWAAADKSGKFHAHGIRYRPSIYAQNDWAAEWSASPLALIPGGYTLASYFGSANSNRELHTTFSGVLIPRGTIALT